MAAKSLERGKTAALVASRTLNPRPQAVVDKVFTGSVFLDPNDLVQVKYEMVRRVRVDNVPVTQAAAHFGFCRQSSTSCATPSRACSWRPASQS